MSVLGNNVKRIRKLKNLSQEELAKRSGYSDKSTISCIESGKRDCSQRQILAIANALGVSPGELFESREVRETKDSVSVRCKGGNTEVVLNGQKISGNITHLSMEIKPLEPPEVTITLIPETLELDGIADITCEIEH